MFAWYVYALIMVVLLSAKQIITKKALSKEHALEYLTTYSLVNLFLLLFFMKNIIFNLPLKYLLILFGLSLVISFGSIFFNKSVKHMEISTVYPLLNLSPLILLVLSFFILGETVTFVQICGILLILLGAYVIEVDHSISHLKSPLVKLFKSKYFIFVLISLVLFSVSSIIEKFLLNSLIPLNLKGSLSLTLMFFIWLFVSIQFSLILHFKYGLTKGIKHAISINGSLIILSSILELSNIFFYYKALSLAYVSLVLPIRRLSTFFTTLIGGELFHDHGLKLKIFGSAIMVVGVILII